MEQALALGAAVWLLRDWWRAGRPLWPAVLDLLFLALGCSIAVSIAYAPLVLGNDFSPRDGYELVKLGLYWVLFRFAWQTARVEGEGAVRAALRVLLGGGALAGLAGVAQYYNWLNINGWLTPAYAAEQHLRALALDGRAVGTVNNPNYYGMLSAFALLAAVALAATRGWHALGRLDRWLMALAFAGGAAGLVTSGSRGALLAVVGGMVVLWVALLLRQRAQPSAYTGATAPPADRTGGTVRRLLLASGGAALAFVLVVALVEAAPRGREEYLARLLHTAGGQEDNSLALRVERLRGVVLPWLGKDGGSAGPDLAPRTTVGTTGVQSASEAAAARDAQRKADVRALVLALVRYRQERGVLPHDLAVLDPDNPAPAGPDGRPYAYEQHGTTFSVAAPLEDPADPDYPLFALGNGGNYIENASLEDGGARADHFRTIAGTRYELTDADALFGRRAARFVGNPDAPGQRAGLFQQRYLGRPGGAPLTAVLWVKLPVPVQGKLELYTNVIYEDGTRSDPHTRVAVDGSRTGVWQRVTAPIDPEIGRTVAYVGVYLVGEQFRGAALVDGFELVEGSVPLSFASLPEAAPGAATLDPQARLRRSPFFGVGPAKAERVSALDDEYLTVAARYGLVGLALYLALWAGAARAGWQGFVRGAFWQGRTLGLALLATTGALLVFNLTAGSLLHLQLMALFWLLAGVTAGAVRPGKDAAGGDGV